MPRLEAEGIFRGKLTKTAILLGDKSSQALSINMQFDVSEWYSPKTKQWVDISEKGLFAYHLLNMVSGKGKVQDYNVDHWYDTFCVNPDYQALSEGECDQLPAFLFEMKRDKKREAEKKDGVEYFTVGRISHFEGSVDSSITSSPPSAVAQALKQFGGALKAAESISDNPAVKQDRATSIDVPDHVTTDPIDQMNNGPAEEPAEMDAGTNNNDDIPF